MTPPPRKTMRVSIHALLAECDLLWGGEHNQKKGFNPRTPCGVRPDKIAWFPFGMEFQSTHSLRSATEYATGLPASSRSFNPRTPCGVRRLIVHGRLFYTGFQSTHSLRSATVSAKSTRERMPVSIHALLAECDKTKTKRKEIKQCFNPRTPCGVRHEHEIHEHVSIQFQSTHSLRSAT